MAWVKLLDMPLDKVNDLSISEIEQICRDDFRASRLYCSMPSYAERNIKTIETLLDAIYADKNINASAKIKIAEWQKEIDDERKSVLKSDEDYIKQVLSDVLSGKIIEDHKAVAIIENDQIHLDGSAGHLSRFNHLAKANEIGLNPILIDNFDNKKINDYLEDLAKCSTWFIDVTVPNFYQFESLSKLLIQFRKTGQVKKVFIKTGSIGLIETLLLLIESKNTIQENTERVLMFIENINKCLNDHYIMDTDYPFEIEEAVHITANDFNTAFSNLSVN